MCVCINTFHTHNPRSYIWHTDRQNKQQIYALLYWNIDSSVCGIYSHAIFQFSYFQQHFGSLPLQSKAKWYTMKTTTTKKKQTFTEIMFKLRIYVYENTYIHTYMQAFTHSFNWCMNIWIHVLQIDFPIFRLSLSPFFIWLCCRCRNFNMKHADNKMK